MESLLGLSALLWDQLISYESAIQQINFLHLYIETVSQQKPSSKFQKDRQRLRLSTAENVKHMYQHYCRRKWTKIESTMSELISSAAVSGISRIAQPELHITQNNSFHPVNQREEESDWSENMFTECDRGN